MISSTSLLAIWNDNIRYLRRKEKLHSAKEIVVLMYILYLEWHAVENLHDTCQEKIDLFGVQTTIRKWVTSNTVSPKRKYTLLSSQVLKTEGGQTECRGCATPYFASSHPGHGVFGFAASVYCLLVETVWGKFSTSILCRNYKNLSLCKTST